MFYRSRRSSPPVGMLEEEVKSSELCKVLSF